MVLEFTTSQALAWQYVQSGVERGLSATSALQQYRGGGGAIRTADWYYLYRGAQDADYAQELSARLPDYLTIGRDAYQYSPTRYELPYIMKVKVTATDSEGYVYASFWRTIERNSNTTRAQWEQQAIAYLRNDKSIPDLVNVDIEEVRFFTTEMWGQGSPEGL